MDVPRSSSSSSDSANAAASVASAAAAARARIAEKSRRHLYGGDADAQAALLLRHRLFPRAMAWNASQQTEQAPTASPVLQPHDALSPYAPPQQQQQQQQHDPSSQLTETPRLGIDAFATPLAATSEHLHSYRAPATHQRHPSLDVTGAFTAFHLNDQQQALPRPAVAATSTATIPAETVNEALNFARAYPLLHAANGVIEQELRRQKENYNLHSNGRSRLERTFARSSSGSHGFPSSTAGSSIASSSASAGAAASQDAREKLFRTMGKWFDGSSANGGSGSNSVANSRSSFASSTGSAALTDDGFLQHIPRRANFDNVAPPPLPLAVSFASTATTTSPSSLTLPPSQQTSYASLEPPRGAQSFSGGSSSTSEPRASIPFQATTPKAASFSGVPLPVHHESRGTPSPTNSNSNWSVASEPRDRRSPPRASNTNSSNSSASYSKKRQRSTPAPSLAKALLTGCGAKRCSFEDCGKIAVSKGLCRGHGGGRRCQFAGCTKCAQSRSPYCWAHGGGKRCEAPNCRRSRKTKHYCVDHVEMEGSTVLPSGGSPADSDESMDGGAASTVASDIDMALMAPTTKKAFTTPDRQSKYPTPAALQSEAMSAGRRAQLAAQLPSLNDALKRSFPSPDALLAAQASERMFHLHLQQQQQRLHVQTFNFDIRR